MTVLIPHHHSLTAVWTALVPSTPSRVAKNKNGMAFSSHVFAPGQLQLMANLHIKHTANLDKKHMANLQFLSTECSIKYISQYFLLFWIAAIIMNKCLHQIYFFYSHDDKSIENLKNIP